LANKIETIAAGLRVPILAPEEIGPKMKLLLRSINTKMVQNDSHHCHLILRGNLWRNARGACRESHFLTTLQIVYILPGGLFQG
jgi:hypothetical protein